MDFIERRRSLLNPLLGVGGMRNDTANVAADILRVAFKGATGTYLNYLILIGQLYFLLNGNPVTAPSIEKIIKKILINIL